MSTLLQLWREVCGRSPALVNPQGKHLIVGEADLILLGSEIERAMLAAAPTPAAQSAGQEVVAWPIMKGVGKINGDGWKDTTKVGQVVYVWNTELPSPYMEGQFPRIGNEGWSASTKQYDFTPATTEEIRDVFSAHSAPVNGGERVKPAPLFMTGWQLLEALDIVAPDRDTDRDQLDCEIALLMGDETGHSGAGLYAWETSEPEEGSSFLAGERAAGKPSDCSGEPECCPQNEGYGCHCGTRNSDVQHAADAPQAGEPDPEYATVARQLGDMAANDTVWDNATLIHRAIALLERAALSSPAKVGGDEPDGEYHAAARAIGDIPCDDFKPEHMTALHTAMALLDRAALSADGGDRKDAERYRIARRKVCIVGDAFHIINVRPTYVAPDASIEFDSAIDAIAAKAKGKSDE